MDQTFDGIDYARLEGLPDFTESFEAEFAAQEMKAFQVATLFQEVEQFDRAFSSGQTDETLFPA